MGLRDRLLAPRVARAITSPSAILLAGGGMSAGILAGFPIVAAAGLGAVAWAVRVAFAVPRAPRGEAIEPGRLRDPWRRFVREALDAQRRYAAACGRTAAGPLRERLVDIGARIDTGVRECWRIAQRGQDLEDALRALDPSEARRELDELSRRSGGRIPRGSDLERTVQSLQAQLSSYDRIAGVARETADRLRLLDARLDEAVARAVELSLRASHGEGDVGGLDSDVDALVTEMESLRQALEETSTSRASGAGALGT